MKKSYDNYFKKVEEIADYFSEEQAEKIISSETDKLYNMLGNQLIKMMKEYINSLSTNAKKEWARKMSYGSEDLER